MPEIKCACGTLVDTEAITGEYCPICKTDLRDYMQAHGPARPETEELEPPPIPEGERCPWCGGKLQFREGCQMCSCGYSACG